MIDLIFDAAYFGLDPDLKRNSGYDNYLELIKEIPYLKRADRALSKVSGKILELGCGVGTYQKLAEKKGLDWLGIDSSTWCYQNKVTEITFSDALDFLKSQKDNSFDFIVSFAFLECQNEKQLQLIKNQMDRVAKNQLHYCYKNPNPDFYNSKNHMIIGVNNIIG